MSTVVVVSGILLKNNKILLAKRSSTKKIAPGEWHIPGRHVEFSEHPKLSLEREFMEELQLKVEVTKPLAVHSFVEDSEHVIIITFLVRTKEIPKVIKFDSSETAEVTWADITESRQLLPKQKHDYKTIEIINDFGTLDS